MDSAHNSSLESGILAGGPEGGLGGEILVERHKEIVR